jgi:hypothetical protein
MNKLKHCFCVFLFLIAGTIARADEGLWLLQLMKEQNSIDLMKKQGLKLEASDLYNPNGISLKDAVGIFGGGCTGEIISPEGLILTNHHCGYGAIQQHSSVEHDYLTDGFWAKTRAEELATKGLKFTFVERIEDITELVNARIAAKEITETESFSQKFLNGLAAEQYKKSDLYGKKGIEPQALPFYAGNRFYLIYKKVYSDVRMVAAPPSSVGKFGGETDNWMWPRHTGDFSMFRIYADANGEPAAYNESNVPLKTKKHLTISIKGLQEGDYAMILGFPGSTSRYLTVSEIKERMEAVNTPRIRIREARQGVLKEMMNASDKIRIQYSSKYASSSNYWKNSIGMNKAIIDNDVLGTKALQESSFTDYAKTQNDSEYAKVVDKINEVVTKTAPLTYQRTCLAESFLTAIELTTPSRQLNQLKEAFESGDAVKIDSMKADLIRIYGILHNKDYDPDVDRKVAKVIFPLYAEMVPAEQRPTIYQVIEQKFGNDYDRFVDVLYDTSIYGNEANLEAFLKNPTAEAIDNDLLSTYNASIINKYN